MGVDIIVDDIDSDLLASAWHRKPGRRTVYAAGWESSRRVYLHRVVMERVLGRSLKRSEVVDHINGNGLDNRRENLRVASHAQNQRNSGARKGSSRFKGVSWKSDMGAWQARIRVAPRRLWLGYFENEEDAAMAYDRAATEHHGPFARLNFER